MIEEQLKHRFQRCLEILNALMDEDGINRNILSERHDCSIRTSAKGKTLDPESDKQAWNPGLFELTVACKQPDDEAWMWAAVAHELRNMTLNFAEATALPLPLHLAKQLKEYTLPLPEEDED